MMVKLIVFVSIFLILIPLSYLWVRGFEYMNKNYPNYKGEDLFDEENK